MASKKQRPADSPSDNRGHRRHTRETAVKAGRSSTQTRPVSDKRPGKPRFFSSQREQFCRLIAFRGYHPTEAYREAYESEGSDDTVRVEASKLRNDPEISQRILQLQKPVIDRGVITLETHLSKLAELRDDAHQNGEFSPAIQAESLRGKVAGFHVEKNLNVSGTLEDLVAGATPKHESSPPVVARARSKKRNR